MERAEGEAAEKARNPSQPTRRLDKLRWRNAGQLASEFRLTLIIADAIPLVESADGLGKNRRNLTTNPGLRGKLLDNNAGNTFNSTDFVSGEERYAESIFIRVPVALP